MLLIVALLGLLSMFSAAADRLIVSPDRLADYDYYLKVENHTVTAVLANGTVIHDGRDPCTSRTNYVVGRVPRSGLPSPCKVHEHRWALRRDQILWKHPQMRFFLPSS